jgi:hypothetical protein
MALRNFIYLDTASLDDYLAALEGYSIEGSVDQTQIEKNDKSAKAGYKIIEAGGGVQKSTETKKSFAITDAAKFQRLYELLEKDESIRYLDMFDEEIWRQIRRGDILEVEANIRLPQSYNMGQMVGEIAPLMNIIEAFGDETVVDEKTRKALGGIGQVAKLSEGKPVPIIFESISTPNFSFTANLSQKFIRVANNELEDQAIVFGKVKRILAKGEQVEVFSLMPGFTRSLPSLKADQKRQMQRNLQKNNLADVVKGPAIILIPLAVYR